MIVSMHVATGAAGGAVVRSRIGAALLGVALHAAGDRVPHQDIASRRFEIGTGVLGVLALAAVRGPFDAATVGAVSAAAPDIEHVVRLPRRAGASCSPATASPAFTVPAEFRPGRSW